MQGRQHSSVRGVWYVQRYARLNRLVVLFHLMIPSYDVTPVLILFFSSFFLRVQHYSVPGRWYHRRLHGYYAGRSLAFGLAPLSAGREGGTDVVLT